MQEFKEIDPILLQICVKSENLTPSQKQQIEEGTIYRHGGFIQFKHGNDIYITRDNPIVKKYLEKQNFRDTEYGSTPVEKITPDSVYHKFGKLHEKYYGSKPTVQWGTTDSQKEELFMREYRKYAALCCDEKLWSQNIPPYYADGSLESLKEFIGSLKEKDPYFKPTLDDFKETPSAKDFATMLRDKKLQGKEIYAHERIEHNLDQAGSSNKEIALFRGWIEHYLGEEQLSLFNAELKTESFLSPEMYKHFKSILAPRVAEEFLKKDEESQNR